MRVFLVNILALVIFMKAQSVRVIDATHEQCVMGEILDVKRELTNAFTQRLQKLEDNIPHMEKQIVDLNKQVATLNKENLQLKKRVNLQESDNRKSRLSGDISHRTCYDWMVHGYTDSGIYLIDPDGKGIGEAPVLVFCDMVTGHTIMHHDTEVEQEISCSGNSCFVQPINYNITRSQLLSLLDVSDKCKQHLEISCLETPLFKDGDALSWWEDIHGRKQTSWSDSGCWCRITNSCTIPRHMCNCDAAVAGRWLTDSGYITDATKLPVAKLVFGGNQGIQLRFKLSALLCYGRKPVSYPQSCHDLWQSGHYLSGYYHIGNPSSAQLVFCNMTHVLHKHSEPQIASTLDVMFYAGLSKRLKTVGPIIFDSAMINVGGGYDASTGVFTAPIQGIYLFHVKSHGFSHGQVTMKKNDVFVGLYDGVNNPKDWSSNSQPFMLELIVGDKVSAQLRIGQIYEKWKTAYTAVFTGFLIRRTDFSL